MNHIPSQLDIVAGNFLGGSNVNGILLYMPPDGTMIGYEDFTSISAWGYDANAFVDCLSDELPPREDWYSETVVRYELSGTVFRKQGFYRVGNVLRHPGQVVAEDEKIGSLVPVENPPNEKDWYRESAVENLPIEIRNRRKVERFARNLDVALEGVHPRPYRSEVCEFDVLAIWLKQNGFPEYQSL